MSHPAPRSPRLAHALRRGRSALLTTFAALAAAGIAGETAGGADRWWRSSRVAEAAAGSLDPGHGHGRASSGTFAHGPGRAARAAGAGLGHVEIGRADRRGAALSVRRHLQLAGAGTYIGELLARRDSALTRWPDRPGRPLAVYVASGAGMTGWRAEYVRQVASAFTAWTHAGVPLRFHLVDDPARADVRVDWVDRFREPISGRTVWSRDDRWWMIDAGITLALHHNDGAPLDADQVHAIALHEVGHLLGLDHTADPANVMAPRVRVRELSAADQATARLLYSVPAGRVR